MVSDYSFTSGITAMKAHSRSLAAIADNVANLNTAGFKHTKIHTQSLTTDKNHGSVYGNYSGASAIRFNRNGVEGTTVLTQRPLDGALVGKGFFITSNNLDLEQTYLTAAGQFAVALEQDDSGASYIRDTAGNYLLGWPYNPESGTFDTGDNIASLQPIRVDSESTLYDAMATDQVNIKANLSADMAAGGSHGISFEIFDGSGDADGFNDGQTMNMIFSKTTTPNIWDVRITANGGTVTTPPFQVEFNETGSQMTIVGGTNANLDVSVNWENSGATNTFNLGLASFTQFSGKNIVNKIDKNGFTEGVLRNKYFGEDGILFGTFTNGATRPIAKIAIGDVPNPGGLNAQMGTYFEITPQSGALAIYDPEASTRAKFIANAYEAASTNLSAEFSNMIITQRAYSSAATTLRTVDEMMQTVTSLK